MTTKSLEDQEREIKDVLRKAERYPIRTSAARKEVLKRLIDLAHSPHPKLKMIAANNLKSFIKDFPDLEDEAINAVYDLCEDPVTKVRITGYAAIVDVSREQLKWVKRNADVLVQLLQSDEPEEVLVVKRSLSQHLDMDPAVTLGVLCDQVVPSDEPMDEEELAIRNRLRSLVLAFITGEAKRAIVERHTSIPGSAAEETLVGGMLKAVGKLPPSEIDVIVKEILMSLPSFKPSSPRGRELLDLLLERARASLKAELPSGGERSSMQQTRHYLSLASHIVIEKRVTQPAPLLRFYFTSLSSKITLLRLDEDAQIFVLSQIADLINSYEERSSQGTGQSPTEDALLRKQIPDVCISRGSNVGAKTVASLPRILASLSTSKHASSDSHKDDYKWTVPSHMATILQHIQSLATAQGQTSKVDNLEDIQNLIRSLLSSAKPPAPAASTSAAPSTTDLSKATSGSTSTSKSERRIMNVKRKYEDRPAAPTPTTAAPPNGTPLTSAVTRPQPPRINAVQPRQQLTIMGTADSTQNGRTAPSDDQYRTAKRAKKGGGPGETGDTPSLLSRLAATSSNGGHAMQASGSIPARWRVEPAPITFNTAQSRPQNALNAPMGGYSIKGAARRSSPVADSQASGTSLLDRLQDSSLDEAIVLEWQDNLWVPMLDYPVISFGAGIDKQSLKFLCRLPDDTKSIL
ncbi:hypothetical protein POSPLADRAFT_1043402 [Postia placenta MAD-698-R-SB12]|uniref:ARM repeat-containing protein n=1 Tax=Postia placenta MAD-698-R-SB12 TaxID=670580 RepID=A0A1X6NBQ4_9APHY|nr:hypothetical protein POSPLADRAFT_1043402 [Postia placenta MAD-698-R-SB12]OSX65813.1 hypothetical protein POSPLADRAFT_1043402 [Postia placenta MAD-698-R-SB12]